MTDLLTQSYNVWTIVLLLCTAGNLLLTHFVRKHNKKTMSFIAGLNMTTIYKVYSPSAHCYVSGTVAAERAISVMSEMTQEAQSEFQITEVPFKEIITLDGVHLNSQISKLKDDDYVPRSNTL